ncbi:Uncharacterized membrane protein [Granulicatella balaenopterae]|uniref:Uncharacterized membrane protein n=1 Tax=Granulicatella balaenopterae TaxID=137733 RepID=A0A1H9MA76_9LACT|nr:DUF2207 domain-containing protein [Granulicatella balaenopterae]SER20588.1 Uncharacterized membrane protein [Granulicatella balaenopterae]
MKKKSLFLSIVMTMTLFIFSEEVVSAKELIVEQYDITAKVLENGDVDFKEQMVFEADGEYNGVFYHLDITGIVAPKNIKLSEVVDGTVIPLENNQSGDHQTYQMTQEDQQIAFKIFTPLSDESRTILLEYTIPECITSYQDIAEFNRKVVGQAWEIEQNSIRFTLELPVEAAKESFRCWGHGNPTGKVEINPNYKMAEWLVSHNEPGEFVEAHALFPVSIVAANPNQVEKEAFTELVATEEERVIADKQAVAKRKAQAEEHERQKAIMVAKIEKIMTVAIGIMAISAVFCIGHMMRLKKAFEKQVPFVPDHVFELPEKLSPSVMQVAVYQEELTSSDVHATIMDLVRRKVLYLSQEEPYTLTLSEKTYALSVSEEIFVEGLFKQIGENNQVTFTDIKNYATKHPKAYCEWFADWEDQVDEEASTVTVLDEEKKKSPLKIFFLQIVAILVTIVGATLGLYLLVNGSIVLGSIATLVNINLAIVAVLWQYISEPKRTIDGEWRYRQWNALKQMMEDISSLDRAEVPSIIIWNELLVYAISFKVADEVLKTLPTIYDQEEIAQNVDAITAQQMATYLLVSKTLSEAQTLSSPTSSSNGNYSGTNSGGFGGGFSSGSSGGFGGGSGGGGF